MLGLITTAVFFSTCHAVSTAIMPDSPKVYYDPENAVNLFKEYLKEHRKSYNVVEYAKRLEIFRNTLEEINELNAKHPKTVYGITLFADMTDEEKLPYTGLEIDDGDEETVPRRQLQLNQGLSDLPSAYDWRDEGVVTPVKNQGHCGSCFVFSAIGNIEGQYALKYDECISFSEQFCMDCLDRTDCKGGQSIEVMQKLMEKDGLMRESDYPYKAKKGSCYGDDTEIVARVTNASLVDVNNDEDTLKLALLHFGPLSISLLLTDRDQFHSYKDDVMRCDESGDRGRHAVVLVGYDVDKEGEEYWIIKNSWGTNWGKEGYLHLAKGSNYCHIIDKLPRLADVAQY